jgi:hypothetical protein
MHTPPEALKKLDKRMSGPPKSLTLAEAFSGEAANFTTWLRGLEKTDATTLFQKGGKLHMLIGGGQEDQLLGLLQQRWTDPKTRAAELAGIIAAASKGAAVLSVPREQVQPALDAYLAERQAAGMLATIVLTPKPEHLRLLNEESEARSAMLRAAIAMRLNGPDALKTIRDPFGDGPFDYKATPHGFELSSRLQKRGEHVKLTIGAAP